MRSSRGYLESLQNRERCGATPRFQSAHFRITRGSSRHSESNSSKQSGWISGSSASCLEMFEKTPHPVQGVWKAFENPRRRKKNFLLGNPEFSTLPMFGKPFFADMQLIQAKVFRPWPISTGHLNPWQWWMSLCIAPSSYLVFVQLELSMNLIANCQILGKLQVLMRNMRFIPHIATSEVKPAWSQKQPRSQFLRAPALLWADAICSSFFLARSRFSTQVN